MTVAIPALPEPVPQSTDPINFDARADAFLGALPATADAMNAQNAENNTLNANVNTKAAQVALDRAATGADRVQTGQDRTATAASAAAALANKIVSETKAGESAGSAAQSLAIYGSTAAQQAAVTAAQNAASVAAGHAASASSVVQQDLSGVNAAALHRSPNAVTAMFVYDTGKDSDGGAWTEKCQHTSWYNEAINGKWLGPVASEAAAREVSGATTGDYFQLTTDGKFYRLNDTSGITETFRGNKRDFPRLSAIVSEASNVTVYDLTRPGRPMWRRVTASSCAGVVALNGWVVTAQANTPVTDYARDQTFNAGGAGTINAVSITALPSAPINPFTGLRIPTVAMARSTGLSVFNAGALVNSSSTLAFNTLTLSPALLSAGRADTTFYWAQNPGLLGASFALQSRTNTQAPDFNTGNTNGLIAPLRNEFIRRSTAAGLVQKLRNHESDPARALAATITSTLTTGYLPGDIRRAYLADNTVGSVPGPELVTNGTFDTDSGWTNSRGVSWSDGQYTIADVGGSDASITQQIAGAVAGKAYTVEIEITANTSTEAGFRVRHGAGAGGAQYGDVLQRAAGFVGVWRFTIIAGQNAPWLTLHTSTTDTAVTVTSISVREGVADRSYKANSARITGTLTKTEVASAAQLVAYSGFSAANYLQEPYSADLDFGVGEWSVGAWVNTPVTLPDSVFKVSPVTLTMDTADWTKGTGWSCPTANSFSCSGAQTAATDLKWSTNVVPASNATSRRWTLTITAVSGTLGVYPNNGTVFAITEPGTYYGYGDSRTSWGTAILRMYDAGQTCTGTLVVDDMAPSSVAERGHTSGPLIGMVVGKLGRLTAIAYDGTTTRTVTTPAAYNTATWRKARVNYTTDGTLAILINGVQVAATRGNPLLTLNNANAVLTIGNSFALDAAFPGSIALLKLSATVPTAEQAVWMYEQEKHLFQAGAQCCLPDAGAIADLTYDEATDKWIAISATNESEWSGLVRTSVTAVPSGSYTRAVAGGGVQLLARSTTTPGVDVTIPAYGLREELVKRAEAAARLNAQTALYDFVGGFTANTTLGNTAILSIANLTYPTRIQGALVTGTGIPANASITDVSGTTGYLSATATATGTSVQINLLDFALPTGLTATAVSVNGVVQREGPTAAYTRLFDGFREVIRFAVAPGNTAWVQIQTVRSAA